MLFNSYLFIFVFLPISLGVYFFLNRYKLLIAGKSWLTFVSILFYAFWDVRYLPLLLGSIFFNYSVGTILGKNKVAIDFRKTVLITGIVVNVGLLAYYKYANFFIGNINLILHSDLVLIKVILPLGISFFTFTQIAFLVDNYKWKATEYDFLNYTLFVTFFPHLIAGPIIHHKELMPQFDRLKNKLFNWRNFSGGLFLFVIGLSKKVLIADKLSPWVASGFDTAIKLSFFEAWGTSLSYTLQLYFDFSGYTDMALGLALMFNIYLPKNFNSPYKALNIQDFWHRWHITLSRFLRDYVYIPLGGNKGNQIFVYRNLFLTFLLGGLWHGAGWTFIFWGALHGVVIIIHRVWRQSGFAMNKVFAWFLTCHFVNIGWVFFRAKNWASALKVLKGMIGLNGVMLPERFNKFAFLNDIGVIFGSNVINESFWLILFSGTACLIFNNSDELLQHIQFNRILVVILAVLFGWSLLNMGQISDFLYFNF